MTFHLKIAAKKDTTFCNFNLYNDKYGEIRTLYVGTRYIVEAWLCTACALIAKGCSGGKEVTGRTVKFAKEDGTVILTMVTDAVTYKGRCASFWTPESTHVGRYKVLMTFGGDADYNSSESSKIEIEVIKEECDQGVEVKVLDVPEAGLTVGAVKEEPIRICDVYWPALVHAKYKTATPDKSTVTFDKRDGYKSGDKLCCAVLTGDKKHRFDYNKDSIRIPATGCTTVKLRGWLGCKFRIMLSRRPTGDIPINTAYQLTATLFETPDKPDGANRTIIFYEEGTKVWEGLTDDKSKAVYTGQKAVVGTYTYTAALKDVDTYLEPKDGLKVNVVERVAVKSYWEQLIEWIMTTLNVERKQAEYIAYGGMGFFVLLIVLALMKG